MTSCLIQQVEWHFLPPFCIYCLPFWQIIHLGSRPLQLQTVESPNPVWTNITIGPMFFLCIGMKQKSLFNAVLYFYSSGDLEHRSHVGKDKKKPHTQSRGLQ